LPDSPISARLTAITALQKHAASASPKNPVASPGGRVIREGFGSARDPSGTSPMASVPRAHDGDANDGLQGYFNSPELGTIDLDHGSSPILAFPGYREATDAPDGLCGAYEALCGARRVMKGPKPYFRLRTRSRALSAPGKGCFAYGRDEPAGSVESVPRRSGQGS
jgi:hypothetical protein